MLNEQGSCFEETVCVCDVLVVFETMLSTGFQLCWNSWGVFADVKTDGDLYLCLFPASESVF
jgi:hypothetical protein